MRPFFCTLGGILVVALASSLIVTVAGCQNPNEAKLRGTWRLEGADQLAELMTGGKPASEGLGGLIDSAVGLVAEQVQASMEVEFNGGGQLVTRTSMSGSTSEKNGTWKVIRSTDDTVVIWFQLDQEDPTEMTVTWMDQDTIKMVPPNIAVLKKSFTFHRVQQ